MDMQYLEYRPRKIVNVHKHVDGPWFWSKYSAHPYIGCRSGCEFCYLRGGVYLGRRDPATFDTLIQVKVNAAELLRKELSRLAPEIIALGDWQQPAEDRYCLSRQMLQVVLELGFPVFIVERSPLLTRDLDLLVEINRRSHARVVYSLSSLDPKLKQAFEPRSPGVKRRLQAMSTLAQAGIPVGASLMPVLPYLGDDPAHLEDAIRAIADAGGNFVLAGGLTMAGVQAQRSLAAAARLDPAMEERWRRLYGWRPGADPSYGPPRAYSARLGNTIRELCTRYNLLDRMPRPILPGPLAINKRIAERLFLKTYDLELRQAGDYQIWAYRKAAWTVDELPESIRSLYEREGLPGLANLPSVGRGIAAEIGAWLGEEEVESR